MKVRTYKDLIVWQRSMELAVEIYHLTEKYPKSELFGMISQSRRCAVSIPSNIAEGRTRGSRKDFRQFLIIAMASGAELETQFVLAKRLHFTEDKNFEKAEGLLLETMKMLNSMTSSLNS